MNVFDTRLLIRSVCAPGLGMMPGAEYLEGMSRFTFLTWPWVFVRFTYSGWAAPSLGTRAFGEGSGYEDFIKQPK